MTMKFAMALKIVEALPIIGPANVQCFRYERRFIFRSELRFSGTLVLSIAAGFNARFI
jgi:hypothetical protein